MAWRQQTDAPRAEEKPELATPTSAQQTGELPADLAIMGKSMNRVSNLHGFENAKFWGSSLSLSPFFQFIVSISWKKKAEIIMWVNINYE